MRDTRNDSREGINAHGRDAGQISTTGSWTYSDQPEPADLEELPDPTEVVRTLKTHEADGERYWAAITGDYRPEFSDPVKATAYLVRGIKKATHETGPRPPGVMETLCYVAENWPKGKHNQSRWWTREEAGKFRDARSLVFSDQTDPDTFFEAPAGAEKRWRQQEQEADKHEAQVRAAFWECLQDAKGGIVFAHHGDIAAHTSVEISEERTRQLLCDWDAVKQVEDPRGNGPTGLNSRSVFAVVNE